ncbi:hypothetical protein ACU4GG_39130 [Streptomyces nojiriensis]
MRPNTGGIVGPNILTDHPERVAGTVVDGAHAERAAVDRAEARLRVKHGVLAAPEQRV